MSDLTYAQVGATRGELPRGYRINDQRGVVGHGRDGFAAIAEALLGFDVHRGAFPRVTVSGERAAVDVEVAGHVGPFSTPCRVVYLLEEERVRGFAYGTLPGNPVRGEEQFSVTLADNGDVGFRMLSFSRPAPFFALVAPLTHAAQDVANRRYFASARRAGAAASRVGFLPSPPPSQVGSRGARDARGLGVRGQGLPDG